MYLLVFVMLMTTVLGLYTQLFVMQVKKSESQDSTMADVMLTWHGGAYAYAKNSLTNLNGQLGISSTGSQGCLLTKGLVTSKLLSSIVQCSPNGFPEATVSAFLPSTYNADQKWYTVIYYPSTGGTSAYILTFAKPPSMDQQATYTIGNSSFDMNAKITSPDIGYSVTELWNQIKASSKAPKTSYGYIKQTATGSAVFYTPDAPGETTGTTGQTFQLPACASYGSISSCIPVGSVGFINVL